ncbi:MAG: hypothetical protein M3417_15575 [Actinomycetota bacterium]|nr:hypothetical protein [Actinomycetota bacterium]
MSLINAVPRLVVGTTLKIARLPLDTVLKLTGRDRSLAADAAEAAVKEAAASITGDTQLKAEATAQKVATDQRRKAEALRTTSTQATEKAESDHAEQQTEVERERQAADQRAADRKRKAAEKRKRDKAAAAKTERDRKAAAAKAKAAEKDQLADKERRERLEQLDREAATLEEKEGALTAADEAQRLKDAAGTAKAKRKADDK